MNTYPAAVEFLAGLGSFGLKPGLGNIRKLSAALGNPHEQLRFIHVAGTNGKGSVCAFLESIYRHAGLKVGLYTSPHLISFTERIQINRQCIPEAAVVALVEKLRPTLASFSHEEHPTFFEAVTAMALRHFADERCDLVIWETGMGGRLDATNLVTPLLSVITTIGFDHMQWLGDTLAKIAGEKAGIIKPGIPVVSGVTQPEAAAVIAAKAAELGSTLHQLPPQNAIPAQAHGRELELGLAGPHQRHNAAVALAAVEALQNVIPVSAEVIARGLATAQWAGRFQMGKLPNERTLILDGAHNADGVEAMLATLQERFPGQKPALVIGMLGDKDCRAITQRLAPAFAQVFTVPVPSSRGLDPEELARLFREAAANVPVKSCPSLRDALDRAGAAAEIVVCTGSLFLIGQALTELGWHSWSGAPEQRLNDWSGSTKTKG